MKSSLFSIAGKENIFLTCFFFYFSWSTLPKFTLITFLRSLMKTRQNMTGAHASVHFENGPNAKIDLKPTNAKNAHENEKMYNRATCLCAYRKWAKCQKRSCKRENVQPGNMPLCISKMGRMPKTLMKTTKMYNRATCLCAFRKWAECQKRS